MSDEDLKSELERLRAENERLKRTSGRGLSLRVSEKGAVSVYGLGRFPVTLYREQWLRLLERTGDLQQLMEEHASELKSKGEGAAEGPAEEPARAEEPGQPESQESAEISQDS